jgi:sodium-independent sulfate anion transporter 11
MPTYGTFSSKLKSKVKKYTGFDDDTPSSVTVKDWFKASETDVRPAVVNYIRSLFPFIEWLPRYNLTWLYGDLIA